MKKAGLILFAFIVVNFSAVPQTVADGDFTLALPQHQGRLVWSAKGFKVIQYSAKPEGLEIGIRGKDDSGRLTFLGFLFLVPEEAPLTGANCRDGAIEPMKKADPTLTIEAAEKPSQNEPAAVTLVRYVAQMRDGKKVYSVRGFVATDDICGDLEVYSDNPIGTDDSVVQKIFATYRFDKSYSPQFDSALLYAQLLYKAQMYKAAAPMFEVALVKLKENPAMAKRMMGETKTATRVVTDQAGMAYGMSGNIPKARSLFEKAISDDPDYPLNLQSCMRGC